MLQKPLHLAVSLDGLSHSFSTLFDLLTLQAEEGIPVLTLHFHDQVQGITHFLESLASSDHVHEHQVKCTVLGKWYDLPQDTVHSLKKCIDETKDYDRFFVNICIAYDGQEEILDGIRLLLKQVQSGKVHEDRLSKEILKENLYSSYFSPPDLYIKCGKRHVVGNTLLWDMGSALIYFVDKPFDDTVLADFTLALEKFELSSK